VPHTQDLVLGILLDVAAGLAYLHSANIVHGVSCWSGTLSCAEALPQSHIVLHRNDNTLHAVNPAVKLIVREGAPQQLVFNSLESLP
jgi:hypothetical protein